MKVQDLVEKLLRLYPELDVFVSPLVDMEIGTLGKQAPNRPTEIGRVVNPMVRYQALNFGLISELIGEQSTFVVIGFDQENPHVEKTEENDEDERVH